MNRKYHQFQVRPGQALGDRLVWQFPLATEEGRAALRPVLGEKEMQSITVGYYFQVTDPAGAWVFMPVNTPHAIAALHVPAVLRRIGEDLAERLREGAPK